MQLKLKFVLELTLISLAFTARSFCSISNSKPNFILKNSNSSDVEIIKENQFFIKTNRLVELDCIADFPIKITVSGIKFNWIEYAEREVIKNNSGSGSDYYYYKASIGFKSNPEATGWYTCSFVTKISTGNGENDSHRISSLYIFAHDGKKPEMILSNKYVQDKITTLSTDTEVLIPCVTPNPHFKQSLHKNHVNSFSHSSILPNNTYTFKPSQGFFLNVKKYNYNLVGTFHCRGNDDIENQVTYQVEIPDYKVNVEESEIYVSLGETVFVKCESIHPTKIYFHYTLQNRRNSQLREEGKVSQNASSYYKYIAILNATVVDKNFLKGIVQCVQVEGSTPYKNPYRQWNVSIVSTPRPSIAVHSFEDALGFRRHKNLFYCSVRKEFTSTMTSIDCQNLVNCETVKRFHPHSYSFALPFNASRGFLAERYLKKELNLDQDNECAIISPAGNSALGIIQCLIVQNMLPQGPDEIMMSKPVVVTMQYFTDLKNKVIAKRDDQYKTEHLLAKLTDVLQFKDLTAIVYFSQNITIICEASSAVFAKGMELRTILKNNTKTIHPHITFDPIHSNDNHKIKVKQTVHIWSMEIVSIECSAYDWDAHTWKKISEHIQVKESQKPKFVDVENLNVTYNIAKNRYEIELQLHDENKMLSCSATCIPLPTIHWRGYNDLTPVEIESSIPNENTIVSTLTINKFTSRHQTEYICIATNIVGQENRTIHVIVKSDIDNYSWSLYLFGALCFVAFFTCIIIVIIQCQTIKQQKIQLSRDDIKQFKEGYASNPKEGDNSAFSVPYNEFYEISNDQFEINKNKMLGKGAFGVVYHGRVSKEDYSGDAAFKTVQSNCGVEKFKSLLSEIKIMIYVGEHENIIRLIAAYTQEIENGIVYLVTELCSLGCLESYLRSKGKIDPNMEVQFSKENQSVKAAKRGKWKGFSKEKLCIWSSQIANGMEYLASKHIVHSDLATRNILLDSNETAKITDFGLSRQMYNYYNYVKKRKNDPLPWKWMAIESLKTLTFSTQSDVWSYGITLWEIFSLGGIPYPGISWTMEFQEMLEQGLRSPKPKLANAQIYSVMRSCWSEEPSERPSFNSLKLLFKELSSKKVKDGEDSDTRPLYLELNDAST